MSFVPALAGSIALVAAILPPINIPPQTGGDAPFPAPPGYLLPWAGGQIEDVTQAEETTFTHNGLSAYAFDFGLNYESVVAARAGRVTFVYDGSNSGGCSSLFQNASNYVVIDHGDGTSALYLHIAGGSAQVAPGDMVKQGEPVAVSGETGFTCAGDDVNPGPHLHFQVQRTSPDSYFTQSLPVAFDDIPRNSGVPDEGASYVSGNFGPGKPQKIGLTPYRVPRIFNPQAKPANAAVVESVPPPAGEQPAPGDGTVHDPNAWFAAATAFAAPSATSTAEPTNTPTKTPTPRAEPSDTPEPPPADTPPPAPSSTPVNSPTAEPETPTTEAGAAEPPATPSSSPPAGPETSSSPLAAQKTIAP